MRRALDASRSEEGVTLIELIVTVVIMGIAFVAILAAMATGIIVSDVYKRQSTAEALLGEWAETLKKVPYVPCPSADQTTGEYAAATVLGGVPAGYTPTFSVKWWDGTSSASAPTVVADDDGGAACLAPGPPDFGLEEIKLTVSSKRGVAKETFILKRNEG